MILDLEDLIVEAKGVGADLEALKSDADSMVYGYVSGRGNITTSERHALFGALGAAKTEIEEAGRDAVATSSFPHQPTPQRKDGTDEAVDGFPRAYVAASMGDALVQAIAETDDDGKRRSFEKLLGQWQRALEKESHTEAANFIEDF